MDAARPPTSWSRRSAADCRSEYVAAMTRAPGPARMVRARILARRTLDRRHARSAVTAPAPSARASLLVSRLHARERRPSPRAGSPRGARRVRARATRARRSGRRSRFPARCRRDAHVALLLSESGAARAARRVGRRRRPVDLHRARRRGRGRARRVDGGDVPHAGARSRAAAPRCTRSRSSRRTTTTGCSGPATSISSAARIRSFAHNGRHGRSPGTSTRRPRTRTAQARRLSRALSRRARRRRGGGARAGSESLERRAGGRPIGATWRHSRPARRSERHRHAWAELAACPISPPDWSRQPR